MKDRERSDVFSLRRRLRRAGLYAALVVCTALGAASQRFADDDDTGPRLPQRQTLTGDWRMSGAGVAPTLLRIEADGARLTVRTRGEDARLMELRVQPGASWAERTIEGRGWLVPVDPRTGRDAADAVAVPVKGELLPRGPTISLQWQARAWRMRDGAFELTDRPVPFRVQLHRVAVVTDLQPRRIRGHDGGRFTLRLTGSGLGHAGPAFLKAYDFGFRYLETNDTDADSALVVTSVRSIDASTLHISGDIRASRGEVVGPHRLELFGGRLAAADDLAVEVVPSNTRILAATAVQRMGTTGLPADAPRTAREAGAITADTPPTVFPTLRDQRVEFERDLLAHRPQRGLGEPAPTEPGVTSTHVLYVVGRGLGPDRIENQRGPDVLVPDQLFASDDPAVRYEFVHHQPPDADRPGGTLGPHLDRGRDRIVGMFETGQRQNLDGMEAMLVLAHIRPGAVPGVKSFRYNGAAGSWLLTQGVTGADLQIRRELDHLPDVAIDPHATRRDEAVRELYLPDRFRVVVRAETEIDVPSVRVFFGLDGEPAVVGGERSVVATRVAGRPDVYRTPPIDLRGPDGDAEASGPSIVAGPETRLTAFILGAPAFRGPALDEVMVRASPPRHNVEGGLWEKTLKRVAEMRGVEMGDPLDFAGKPETTISNLILIDGQVRSVGVRYGDHAAMLLLKNEFVSMLRRKLHELNGIDLRDDWAVFDYRRGLRAPVLEGSYIARLPVSAPGERANARALEDVPRIMAWTNFLFGTDRDDISYADTFDPELLNDRTRFGGELTPQEWMIEATRQVIQQQRFGLQRALQIARDVPDNDPEALLYLVGVEFDAVEGQLLPKLMKRSREGSGRWVPHDVARSFVGAVADKARNVNAQQALADQDTDTVVLILAPATLLSGPAGAFAGVVASTVEAGDVLFNRMPRWDREDREMVMAEGAIPVLGEGRYDLAKLEQTDPFWRGLRLLGASVGVAFDAATLGQVLRTARASRAMEGVLQKVETEGLEGLGQLGRDDQLRLFAMAAEARAAEQAGDSLSELHRRALASCEDLSTEVIRQPVRWGSGSDTAAFGTGLPTEPQGMARLVPEPLIARARQGLEHLGYPADQAQRLARGLLRRHPDMPPHLVQVAGAIENPVEFPLDVLRQRANLDDSEIRDHLVDYLRRFGGMDESSAARRVRQYMGADEPIDVGSSGGIAMESIENAPDMAPVSSRAPTYIDYEGFDQAWERAMHGAEAPRPGRDHIAEYVDAQKRLTRVNARSFGRDQEWIDNKLEAIDREWDRLHELVDHVESLTGYRQLGDYEVLRFHLRKGNTQTEALAGLMFHVPRHSDVSPARVADELGLTAEQHVGAVYRWMRRYGEGGDPQAIRAWIVDYFRGAVDEATVLRVIDSPS